MTHSQAIHSESVIQLVDALCRIPSFWKKDKASEHEFAIAIKLYLEEHAPWLQVSIENIQDGEVQRPNLLALSGSEKEVELLIIGHLDTVEPSSGWTVEEHVIQNGRYYALGASDAKGGIAGILDAVRRAGRTDRVALLFYSDEETLFKGMEAFVRDPPEIRPQQMLSVCGAKAKILRSCRGCMEFDFVIAGNSGHAARQHEGANAVFAMCETVRALQDFCENAGGDIPTSCNVAAIKAGSLEPGAEIPVKVDDVKDLEAPIPNVGFKANKIPNAAWARVDIRPGGPHVSMIAVRKVVEEAVARWNEQHVKKGGLHTCRIELFVERFAHDHYISPDGAPDDITSATEAVHGGARVSPHDFGYIDIAMLASKCPDATAICMAPMNGNAHSPDEWVDLDSLVAYRDGLIELLNRFAA